MDIKNLKCPFCLLNVDNNNIVICSSCKKTHHKECWEYNLNRCTTFACKGIAIDYDLMISRENENIYNSENINNSGIINKVPIKFKPEKPIPVAKNRYKDTKKIIVKNTKLSDILNTQNNREEEVYQKIEAPNYIPDYINDSLSDYHKKLKEEKLKMRSIIQKNSFKPRKINEEKNKNNFSKEIDYIPDYVNEDIEKYHKRLNSEKLKSLIFKKMNTFITDNIRKKKEQYIIPRPDPFIPEFVHRDLKEYVKELIEEKKNKSRKSKYMKNDNQILYDNSINENIIYENDIPKPEKIIPEYTKSNNNKFDTSFLNSLIETKKCIKCKKTISKKLNICNFCNSEQTYIKSNLVNYSKIVDDLVNQYSNYSLILENKNIYINDDGIKEIFLSPSSKYITFINQNNYLRIIDIDTSSTKVILKGHKGKISSVLFVNDLNIYTGASDTLIKKWNIDNGKCLETLEGHETIIDLLEYSYINQNIISGGAFGILKVWDINKKKVKKIINDNSKWINTIAYSINNFFVASGNSDNLINIWETNNFSIVKVLNEHLGQINCLKYSPNGYFLASASTDGTIKIWDLISFECISTIKGHYGSINYIDYSPDSKLLVSAGYDKTIKIWDLNKNICLKILIGHTESINCVKFSPNGKYILSCSDDKTIKIWSLF